MHQHRRLFLRLAVAAAAAAAPLSLIEKSAEIENCDRKLQAALGGSGGGGRTEHDGETEGYREPRI